MEEKVRAQFNAARSSQQEQASVKTSEPGPATPSNEEIAPASFLADKRSDGEKNLQLARAALENVRATLYNKKENGAFKSTNKFSLAKEYDQEVERISNAIRELSHIEEASSDPDEYFRRIWNGKGHNCDHLAYAATWWINNHSRSGFWIKEAEDVMVRRLVFTGFHTASVIGNVPPECLELDMKNWPDHVAICDPWLNVACLAKDYPDRFQKKMNKWGEQGKMIQLADGNWVDPRESAWINMINAKRVMF